MSQTKAQELAGEGLALYGAERYLEAEAKYKEAISIAVFSHWATQDIYGQYSMVLKKLGKAKEALNMLEMALSSALESDPDSNGVTIARHFLAEYLIELNEPQKALKGLEPVLDLEVALKWLIHFSAANAYYHLADTLNYERQASEVVKTGPSNRFSDVESVKKQIESNAQK